MLRKLRIILAVIFFTGITLLLIGIRHEWFGWMAKLQFLPACLALNSLTMAAVFVLTLLMGRIYCSVICPLGVFQDGVIWIRRQLGKLTKKRVTKRFRYSQPGKWIKYGVLTVFILSLIIGIQPLVALIEPYSTYGRMVSSICHPQWPVYLIGAVSLIGIGACAWLWGRAWCNDICPVGTILGLISKHSVLKPRMIGDGCNHCGRCERGCKASCIDAEHQSIDYSRCIDCFDCIIRCKQNVIQFGRGPQKKPVSISRRNALKSIGVLAGISAISKVEAAATQASSQEKTAKRITPPGSGSMQNFYSKCTACQLCIDSCPNHVLVPSGDLEHFMQPTMTFESGFCRPECNVCSTVCPTGAIKPLKEFEKMDIQIGNASIDHDKCLKWSGKAHCEGCLIHCPSGAIRMLKPNDGSKPMPYVIESRCIGCGACESLCPAKAIHVEGYKDHIRK